MRGDPAVTKPGKRPLRALTASEKVEAIQRVHEGESKASVARDIGVPESTLRGWCKSENKIRGMTRNSSTPDSEAHSPASNSSTNGGNVGNAGPIPVAGTSHSSEDEGAPAAKRVKIEQNAGPAHPNMFGLNENIENEAVRAEMQSKLEYMSLIASFASMRPENGAMLLQHLGILPGSSANANFMKTLLGMHAAGFPPTSSTVGLVENGLQYTKSTVNGTVNGNGHHPRHSLSALAPTQMESVTKTSTTRRSLPSPVDTSSPFRPISPRRTNENYANCVPQPHYRNNKSSTVTKQYDESLWNWLTQQQQLMGQQSVCYNPALEGSFWQNYKHYGNNQMEATDLSSPAKRSPTKAKAVIDNVLCNNNNENLARGLNGENTNGQEEAAAASAAAVEHGEIFVRWLDGLSNEPSVSRSHILQLKKLISNLRMPKTKSHLGIRRSRK